MRYYNPPKPNPYTPKEGVKLIVLDDLKAKHESKQAVLTEEDRRDVLRFDSQGDMNRSIAWFRYIADMKRYDLTAVRYYYELRSEILDFSYRIINDDLSQEVVAGHQTKVINLFYLYVGHLYLLYTFHYLTDQIHDENLDFESIRLLPSLFSNDEQNIMWSYCFDVLSKHSSKFLTSWFHSYLFGLQDKMKHSLITIGDFTLANLERLVTTKVRRLLTTSQATAFSSGQILLE